MGWVPGPSTQISSWTDGRDSYVAGLVHVRQEPGDGDVADSLLEEHLLDGGGADGAQRGQEQEELSKATGLSRVPERHFPMGQKRTFLRSVQPVQMVHKETDNE